MKTNLFINKLGREIKKVFTFPSAIQFGIILAYFFFMTSTQAYASATIWTKANEIMKSVYTEVVKISTIAAVVTASVALLLMNFSKNGRTVDESRAWLKRIIITWAILNGHFVVATTLRKGLMKTK